MPTLELLIDASGAQRGAQQAEAALRTVTAQAERTATTVRSVGPSLSGAFQVGGGSVQIAQGISQTAQAFGQLNTQAALFSASRTALELGNTIRDFQQFRGAIGGASSVLGVLGTVIRANPIGAVATAIGLAATAMSLFGRNTKEATKEVTAQVSELAKLQASVPDIAARGALGESDPRGENRRIIDTILALRSQPGALQANSAASLFGVSEEFLRYGLAESGIRPDATSLGGQPGFQVQRDALGRPVGPREGTPPPAGIAAAAQGFAVTQIPASDLARFGEILLQQRSSRTRVSTTSGESDTLLAGLTLEQRFAEEEFGRANREAARQKQEDAAARIAESLERAAQFGEQIGASVGDAASQLLFAGSTLRTVVAGLVRQFATQGLQSAGAGIFGAITRGVAGATQPQITANAGPPGGIGPPIP